MQIELRSDHVIIDGYVNAVGRDSRPIRCQTGDFVEQVEPGVFGKALKRAKNIKLLLNHRKDRELGSTAEGSLTLTEDSIGLRAHAVVTDEEVIRKARNKLLSGWSFGMYVNSSEMEQRSNAIPRRTLKDIDIFEVSIIDSTMTPYYAGTSVECRAEGEDVLAETRAFDDTAENVTVSDDYYIGYEEKLAQLRAECQWRDAEKRLVELRYNPFHDPKNGRFTSGGGGGGGGYIFMVPKGQSGKGVLLKDVGLTDKTEANLYYHSVYASSNINNGKHKLVNGRNENTTATASGKGEKFGVTGGAGTAYTIVKTDDGNKAIRNDYLFTGDDGKTYISSKSLAVPKPTAKSGIDYKKSPHSAMPDTIAGVSPGKAMTFEEADNGRANPNYSPNSYGYSHNCQSVVPTHEARMRGYDVEARPKSGAVARDLSYDTTLAWIDPTTGKKPSLTLLTGDKGIELDRIIKDGERYSIEFSHSHGGHIITASRDNNGKVRLYDPQTNRKAVGTKEVDEYFSIRRARNVKYLRVDNLDFNEEVLDAITKKPKSR